MFYTKKCFWWCSLGFVVFLVTFVINAEIACSAENPFAGIFNKPITQTEESVNSVNESFKKFPDRALSLNEFVYVLTHKNQKVIRALYVQSGKKVPYIDFMQAYDKKHVGIMGIDQTLIINNHTFVCHCGCVQKTQWNHWEPPPRYKIKTKFNLRVSGTNDSVKCICGCNETLKSTKLDARKLLRKE